MVVSKRSHEKCQSVINGALTFLLFKSNKKKGFLRTIDLKTSTDDELRKMKNSQTKILISCFVLYINFQSYLFPQWRKDYHLHLE